MNKRFSTLLATALVAGGVSAFALNVPSPKIESGKNYVLALDETNCINLHQGEDAIYAGKATVATDNSGYNQQLWSIEMTTENGSNRFVFRNKANGLSFSFDPKNAIAVDATGALAATFTADMNPAGALSSETAETKWTWKEHNAAALNTPNFLSCSISTDSTMTVVVKDNWFYAVKYDNRVGITNFNGAVQLAIAPKVPGSVVMTADDLNAGNPSFSLSTNKTLKDGGQLVGVNFKAVVNTGSEYVSLMNVDKSTTSKPVWLMTDTAVWAADHTLADKLYRLNNKAQAPNELVGNTWTFKFTRNLFTDSVQISVANDAKYQMADGKPVKQLTKLTDTENVIISSIKLDNANLLTLYKADTETDKQNLWFKIGEYKAPIDKTMTSADDNVYYIKNAKGQYLANPIYEAEADYDADAKWVTVDKKDVAHMPAFQWVVLKDNTDKDAAATSPVSIFGREFNSGETADMAGIQLHKAVAKNFYKFGSTTNIAGVELDSIQAIPVDATVLADSTMGYKYLGDKEEVLKVNRYTFNYLNVLNMDTYLNKNAGDSLATIMNGKRSFAIEEVTGLTKYGFTVTEDIEERIPGLKNLYRASYKVYIPAAEKKYLDIATENNFAFYAKQSDATTFYFKEENQIEDNCYHALVVADGEEYTKAGVKDENGILRNQVWSETRTSAFLIAPNNAPLYRRFNSETLEGNKDQADTLRFIEKYRGEMLQVEANPNFVKEGITFLGIDDADFTKDGKAFIVDTAWTGCGLKPQYLISINRNDNGNDHSIMCPICKEIVENGGERPANCPHDEAYANSFNFGWYLVNFADSTDTDYAWKGYDRAGFVKAAHQGDSLFILKDQFADWTVADFDSTKLIAAVKADSKLNINDYVKNLQGEAHKTVTWSMRYVNPEAAAEEIEENRAFLIESQKGGNTEPDIAPVNGQWLKMQNGCIVLSGSAAGSKSVFDEFTQEDDALIFTVDAEEKDLATENESIEATGVAVVATEGAVIVKGAEGKKVVINNVLGQTIANTVVTSDEATIAAPQGVVVVTVEGEAAVKAIVK